VLDKICHEINLIAGHRTVARGGLRAQLRCVEARVVALALATL
jgi:hypothetical protein